MKKLSCKRMTAITAKQIINKMADINTQLPDLNHGGCGVFACYFAEKMISFGYGAHVVELSTESWYSTTTSHEEFEENNKNMHAAKERNVNPKYLGVWADSHYCVKIDSYYFDSKVAAKEVGGKLMMYDGNSYTVIGEVPIKDMEYISIVNRGTGIWNDMYDSSDNDKVKEFIDTALSFLEPKNK